MAPFIRLWSARVLIALAGLYVVLTAGVWAFQRDLLYRPHTALVRPEDMGLTGVQMVWLTAADGVRTVGWYSPPPAGAPTLVFFHGNGGVISDRHWRMRRWTKAGYGVFLTEYRGYGGSEGAPSESGIFADGRAALDWLAAQGVASTSLFLVGESLGSGVAVKLATERRVAGVMLEAPYTSTADVAKLLFPALPVDWLMWDRYDSLSRIKEIHAPLLVMHGGADGTIPQAQGRALLAAALAPKVGYFPDGAHHMDLILHGAYDQIDAFVAAHWKAPAG